MKRETLPLAAMAALSFAVAAPGAAMARGQAEAILAQPASAVARPMIEAERWRCRGAACRGPVNLITGRLDGPLALSICRDLVRKAGPVRELRLGAAVMPARLLAECNAGAGDARTVLARQDESEATLTVRARRPIAPLWPTPHARASSSTPTPAR
jgi:hypothetical protein